MSDPNKNTMTPPKKGTPVVKDGEKALDEVALRILCAQITHMGINQSRGTVEQWMTASFEYAALFKVQNQER